MSETTLHNEKELLLKVAGGDEPAFRTLFDMLVAPLQYFAKQIIKEEQDAEDTVSLAFHKLWENRDRFSSLGELRSFMYITIRRQCIDLIRHRSMADVVHRELLLTQALDESYAESKLLQTELLRLVYSEIGLLPERYSTVLRWSFIEEISTAEMALRLGKSEGHVRADRSRGLALLRAALRNKGMLEAAIALYALWKEHGL